MSDGYPKEFIERVRRENDIAGVIGEYTNLKKEGGRCFGSCPFCEQTDEQTLLVSKEKQVYQCYDCGASGDVFSFVMKANGISLNDAVRLLAARREIALPALKDTGREEAARNNTLLAMERTAAGVYHHNLTETRDREGVRYLSERGISPEAVRHFGLGYARFRGNQICRTLKSEGFSPEMIRACGLVSSYRGQEYDKFKGRLMFPIRDIDGRVTGFGGRLIRDQPYSPKYLNSPETPVFDKGHTLYHLDCAKDSEKEGIILCEGYMDVLSLWQAGFDNAAASLGTSLTKGQAALLAEHTDRVILSYDSDGAGRRAALRAIPILEKAGMDVSVLDLSPYKDPDECIRAEGSGAFADRLAAAKDSPEFLLDELGDRYSGEELEQKIAQRIASEEPEKQEQFLAVLEANSKLPDNSKEVAWPDLGWLDEMEISVD